MSERTEGGLSVNAMANISIFDDSPMLQQKDCDIPSPPLSPKSPKSSTEVSSTTDMHQHSSTTSILATMNSFVKAVNEMDETILIPSKLQDMEAGSLSKDGGDTSTALVSRSDFNNKDGDGMSPDMLAYYHTLNAIKTELVHGPNTDDEDEDDEMTEQQQQDPSFQASKAFRHHLQGLFGVLKQLTGSAQFLTSRYQEEIGELASGSGASSGLSTFTL